MMINPDEYYDKYIKGKSKEQILTIIRGLKKEMGRLKNIKESQSMSSIEDTLIHRTREYLDRAKQAYAEAGGTYTLSELEKRAVDFDVNMDAICKITFNIGGYLYGYSTYIVELSDGLKAYANSWQDEEPLVLMNADNTEPFTRDTYMAYLMELHIGEWRRRYTTQRFGYMVLDGTQWHLKFEYSNGHRPVRIDGDNSYPYNFDKLQILFGIVETEKDADE